MIDLGRYAFDVWLAYGVTGLLLAGLLGRTWQRSRAVKARLRERGE